MSSGHCLRVDLQQHLLSRLDVGVPHDPLLHLAQNQASDAQARKRGQSSSPEDLLQCRVPRHHVLVVVILKRHVDLPRGHVTGAAHVGGAIAGGWRRALSGACSMAAA